MRMNRFTWLTVASAAAAMLLTAACGGVSSSDKTATAQAGGTPARSPTVTTPGAGGGALTGTPAVQVTPSPGVTGTPAAATATVPAGGSVVSISASNILFDKNELDAKAGAITVQFDNKDSGIPHSFAVYRSKDDLTNPIGATEIATGPVMLTLQLTLEKGEYYFDCQVHPTTMNGTLKVE